MPVIILAAVSVAALPFLFREAENHILDAGALTPLSGGLALDARVLLAPTHTPT